MDWLLAEHRAGTILFSGPTPDKTYGIYVLAASGLEEARRIAAADPHHIHGDRSMEVLEWDAQRAFRLEGPTIEQVEGMATPSPDGSVAGGRPWDGLLSDLERAIFEQAGYGTPGGAGARPALLVVDVTHEFVGDRPEPILESIKRFPNSCGEVAWSAMERIRDLLSVCREHGVPVFYTKGMDDRNATTRGAWGWKKAAGAESRIKSNPIGNHIPDLIAPGPGELVIQKTKPSAFFGTPLASYLTHHRVDTVLVTGTTTSGCIRGTVLDAFSNNFRPIVIEDAVFDRSELSHKVNLFDMNAKYADVVSAESAIAYVRELQPAAAVTVV
jgi:nicotinamidase-related amidase